MAEVNTDAGLGLSEFLKSAPVATEGTKPSQDSKPAPTETKSEAKPVESASAKEVEKAPEAVGVKPEAKEEKKDEPKTQALDWDADDNPYRKRYMDTSRWANQINQQNAELKRNFEILNKKLDGTYDPEKDAQPAVPVEQISAVSEIRGRALASLESAVDWAKQNGKDQAWVEKQIATFDATLGQDPVVQLRILQSRSPIMEAFKIMGEHTNRQKWGKDFGEMEKNIRADEAKKFEAKIEEMVNKRLEERLKNINKQPTGIREAREATSDSTANGGFRPKPLDQIFG